MNTEMRRIYKITLLSAAAVILFALGVNFLLRDKEPDGNVKVGFVFLGDTSTAYTNNFERAKKKVESQYDGQIQTISKYNVSEENIEEALDELEKTGCRLIFTTSSGYGEKAKEYAVAHPDIQFCQAACSNANEEPAVSNYHTFMGNIYQGRYISGVVAGMKIKELIDIGGITVAEAKAGYVGSYPCAEVTSGYTAFFLGIRSVVPEATMTVKYTNAWGNYILEKECARELIDEGCVIISQHSDTAGPAAACEETDTLKVVYHVGYNESMGDLAPTTYLTGAKVNWEPYIAGAVKAILSGKKIETCVKGNVNGNDVGAGFENDWVRMLDLNEFVAAKGTKERIEGLIRDFRQNRIQVFKGEYTGVNPDDPTDTIDLRDGFQENETSSAPTFHYILDDVITVE